jgi:hypothetical protein
MLTEAVVRESLRNEVLAANPEPSEAVYEFWVPRTHERADVAVIGKTLQGFEIKTERDTLKRLPRQSEAYARLFDRCYTVLALRHVDQALAMLPPWWGVLVIEPRDGLTFGVVRDAGTNDGVDPEILVRLLWREEAYAALCTVGDAPDPRAGRSRLWELLLTVLDLDGLKRAVRNALLRRDPAQARIPSRRFAIS